jgi:hypothetical protein
MLAVRRYHAEGADGDSVSYDPRFLMFEYTCNMILREEQVTGLPFALAQPSPAGASRLKGP